MLATRALFVPAVPYAHLSLETVVEWVYQTGFSLYHLGYATSMALFLVVVIGLVSMGQFLLLRDTTEV